LEVGRLSAIFASLGTSRFGTEDPVEVDVCVGFVEFGVLLLGVPLTDVDFAGAEDVIFDGGPVGLEGFGSVDILVIGT
jgi:hypothetical protein